MSTLADGDPRHGTTNGYVNLRCRCQPCRDAWAASARSMRRRRTEKGLAPDDPRHGRYTTYTNSGCRCDGCLDAWAAYKRFLNARKRGTQ